MSIELERMTPSRAAYFMERFKREEKLLGPNEQAALTYVIDMLEKATAIQQPAKGEPVAWMASYVDPVGNDHVYVTSHHDLAVENDMHGEPKPLYTRPAPSVPKDDQIAALVNKVRDIARMFHDHQSLRERIAIELVPALKVYQEAKSDAERGRFLIEWLKRYGLLHAEFGQMGVGKKPENWWLLHAPWGIDQTRPFLGHGKTPEQAIDAAKDAT